jgi:hypothetical protein
MPGTPRSTRSEQINPIARARFMRRVAVIDMEIQRSTGPTSYGRRASEIHSIE